MKRNGSIIAWFVLMLAATWLLIARSGTATDWLTVKAPQFAEPGKSFPIQVHATRAPTAAILRVDLHWAVDRNATKGVLAAGEGQAVTEAGGTFDLPLSIPPQAGLRFVTVVLYLSPDGNWSNHTFVATTKLIPVRDHQDSQPAKLITWPVFQLEERPAPPSSLASPLARCATGIGWLLCAIFLWLFHRPFFTWQLTWFIGLLLAALWELAGLERSIGAMARNLARAEDVYYSRLMFQQALVSVAIALGAVILARGLRQQRFRWPLLCFGIYLVVAAVNLVSLHAWDRLASQSLLGVALVDLIKLLIATLALAGFISLRRRAAS